MKPPTVRNPALTAFRRSAIPALLLSASALAVGEAMKVARQGDYLFPGARAGRPISNMAMLVLLRRMKRHDVTVHGFRSTFSDWAAEHTNFPSEVVEMALAHAVGNKVEAAYRRGDLFDKRRKLMDAWAGYCERSESGKVLPYSRRA